MAYELEGRLLEVCTCNILCPCWGGGDPDNDGTCQSIVAWHIDKGTIDGTDVSDLTFALLCNIPGNVLRKGTWRVVAIVDEQATPQQQEAILSVWTGQKGGPVADLAQLVGEVVAVERLPVTFEVEGGQGNIKIGGLATAELAPLVGATGLPTTLHDSAFSTIPGSPAYLGRASVYKLNVPALGLNIDLRDHNAIQGDFRFVS